MTNPQSLQSDDHGFLDAEVALRRSEERFLNLFRRMNVAFALYEIVLDAEGRPIDSRFLDVNAEFERISGMAREQVAGRLASEVLPDADAAWIELFGKVALGGEALDFVTYVPQIDRWLEIRTYSPEHGRFAALYFDVTERKRMEKRLAESEERLRLALDAAHTGIWDWNIPAGETVWNPEGHRMLGQAPSDEPIPLSELVARIHPADLDRVQPLFEQMMTAGADFEGEFRARHASGEWRHIYSRGKVVAWDEDGRAVRALGAHMDVTALRRAELELERFFLLSPDPFCVSMFSAPRLLRVNKAFASLLGRSEEDLLSGSYERFVHPDDLESTREFVANELGRREGVLTFNNRYLRKDGATVWLRWMVLPILEEDRAYALAYDITGMKQAEGRLLADKEIAETASRTKSAFLANMSHEIRTPLNGLLGMLQLLQMSSLSEEQTDYVAEAVASCRRLSRLLGDILDLTRIEAGKMVIRQEPFSLPDILNSLGKLFGPTAAQQGVELEFVCCEGVSHALLGDPARIQQILGNLIGNALKFTEAGRISVEACALTPLRPGTRRLLFSVADTGTGVDLARQQSLFSPYVQGESHRARPGQGAGLGLSIVKMLVELMGGTVAMDSEVGAGSTVYFTLTLGDAEETIRKLETSGAPGEPDSPAEEPAAAREASASGEPLRILVVEDDPINLKTIRRFLEIRGHGVASAGSGEEALETMRRELFDLVFMDIQLPGMDGLETTRIFRESPEFAAGAAQPETTPATTPVVALTAFAMTGDRERMLAAGMTDYLSKPLELNELDRVLGAVRAVKCGAG